LSVLIVHEKKYTEKKMSFLLTLHSHTRWLVALAGLAAILKLGWGMYKGGAFGKLDRALAAAFSGLMDLQATLGLVFLLWSGFAGAGFPPARIEHATTMILAVVLGHLPARWKNAPSATRFRNTLFCILGALAFIYLGVTRLRGGWLW